jgi:uncharacterized protein (DUF58 family)
VKYFGASISRFNPWTNRRSRIRQASISRRILPFSFSITRQGAIYVCCVFLLSWATINTGNNLLFLVLAALISSIAISGIISRNTLEQISLSVQVPENVFVGERVFVKVSMKNTKRIFPSFSIRAEDPGMSRAHSPFGWLWRKSLHNGRDSASGRAPAQPVFLQSAYFPILPAGETRAELITQSFARRGLYTLDGFWISTRFPFGFFRRGQRIGARGEVLVYPSIQPISSFFHLLPFLAGPLEGMHVGLGENLFSIRKYQDGESARLIDWKATSKTGELMAREFAREEENRFCLILDTRIQAPAAGQEIRFEKAVSLAASIAAHFLDEGAVMEFLTPYEYLARGSGRDHLYRILRLLAVAQYEAAKPLKADEPWEKNSFPGIGEGQALQRILSDKVFKIIISSKPRGSFPSVIWRSSHVVYFDEL